VTTGQWPHNQLLTSKGSIPRTIIYCELLLSRNREGGAQLRSHCADGERALHTNGKPTQRHHRGAQQETLRLTSSGELAEMKGEPIKAGHVSFARVSIGYFEHYKCRQPQLPLAIARGIGT
jgi:hypothetical protein